MVNVVAGCVPVSHNRPDVAFQIMNHLGRFFAWCMNHWSQLGTPALLVGMGGLFKWLYPSRKDWADERRAKAARTREKAERDVDSKIISALNDRTIWTGAVSVTGAGYAAVRATQIAEVMILDRQIVVDSLERLEVQGRVRKGGGTFSDPAPYWTIIHR